MISKQLKETFTQLTLGFLVLFIVLAPISVSLQPSLDGNVGITLVSEPAVAYASDPSGWIGQQVGNIMLTISSFFTWLGGLILETAINKLVYGMGTMLNSDGLGASIDIMWKLIRDISNLAFIFGFIYIGIRTIIDPDNVSTKRFLAQIIIGALLINFSLFITKFVIDFSNFTATQIYTTMTGGSGEISATFANQLGISGFYKTLEPAALEEMTKDGAISFYVMASIMLLIAGFVLAAGGILLIVRFVALIFIMIFSPLLFAATVFPQTAHYATDLWRKLISYSFFAPAYLLLLLITIKVIGGVGTSLGVGSTALSEALRKSTPASSVDSFTVIINFVIIIMFLIMSLKIAQQMGVKGGDMAVSIGNNLKGRGQRFLGAAAGAATVGLAARTGRATIGRLAHNLSERDGLKDAASTRGVRGFMARQTLKGTRAVGDASFDARNVAGAGKALGVGEGRKGGYTTVKKEVEEKEMKFAKSLGEIDDEDMLVKARKESMEEAKKNLNRNRDRLKKEGKYDELEKLEKDVADAEKNYNQEKNRRVLGGTYTKGTDENQLKVQRETLTALSKNIKDTTSRLNNTTNVEEQEFLKQQIKNDTERYSQATEKLNAQSSEDSNTQGYVSTLEKSTRWNSWPAGRMVTHEKEAGKAMRKAYTKKIKKSQSEKQHDELVEAAKSKESK